MPSTKRGFLAVPSTVSEAPASAIPDSARRLLTLSVVLIGVYIVLDIVAQLLPPHYSPISQAESDLAVGPYGYIMTVNFVVRGLLSGAFIVGLGLSTNVTRRSRAGTACLWVWAVGAVLLAAFPTDVGPSETSLHGKLHLLIAFLAFIAIAVGEYLLSRSFVDEPRLRTFAPTSKAIAFFALLALAIYFFATPVPYLFHHAYGLLERIFIGLALLWILVVSLYLLQPSRKRRAVVPWAD